MKQTTNFAVAAALTFLGTVGAVNAQEGQLDHQFLTEDQNQAVELYRDFKECSVELSNDQERAAELQAQEAAENKFLNDLNRFTEESGANAILDDIAIAIEASNDPSEIEQLKDQRSMLLRDVWKKAEEQGIVRPVFDNMLLPVNVACTFEMVHKGAEHGLYPDDINSLLNDAYDILGEAEFEARTFVEGYEP